jgi:DNA-directed RNA polymerase specialized sigma24 family protein
MGAPMKRSDTETPQIFPNRSTDPRADFKTLHALLPELDDDSLLAVYMRFWERMTIQEISKVLGRTWDETDHLIERSMQNLRDGFVAHGTNIEIAAA